MRMFHQARLGRAAEPLIEVRLAFAVVRPGDDCVLAVPIRHVPNSEATQIKEYRFAEFRRLAMNHSIGIQQRYQQRLPARNRIAEPYEQTPVRRGAQTFDV